ncbi:MAG: hypothetical protein KGJ65_13830 [Betaproteobacteria bacterium]|nr:hypothetical protein [Betaproteobacteria bacterium]MDE2124728.1 hypothetical protein [Betaproteobacteria bacterium]MDE2186963.1 hypothetical protein [Betaproteobacteria bacterium]
MTIMTTWRSGPHKTPFETIEFTHAKGTRAGQAYCALRSHRSQLRRAGLGDPWVTRIPHFH